MKLQRQPRVHSYVYKNRDSNTLANTASVGNTDYIREINTNIDTDWGILFSEASNHVMDS